MRYVALWNSRLLRFSYDMTFPPFFNSYLPRLKIDQQCQYINYIQYRNF